MTVAAIARELVRRFDLTVAYLHSFFDDPRTDGKGSMVRLCAIIGMAAGVWFTARVFDFAFAHWGETGALGILAGAAALFLTGVVLHLLTRTRADQSIEPDDAPAPTSDDHR